MRRWLSYHIIKWARKRVHYWERQRVVSHDSRQLLFRRFALFWPDEWINPKTKKCHHKLPWYRPFNIFLHWWNPEINYVERMHDHPRWSITICLRGKLIERTPWNERILTPGSIVIRSCKAIHSFEIPTGYRGKTWTFFIVGRRKHQQNTYNIKKF